MGNLERQVIVTCEHASNRLPPGFTLDEDLRRCHIAWDPGADRVARRMAAEFGAPLFCGEYSRLVVDLNRTVGNRMLIRRVSDGQRIRFNYGLDEAARRERIERYYRPYREAVIEAVDRTIQRAGRCVHICVHTYTPELAGRLRGNDIGLLHDPRWGVERAACDEIRTWMQRHSDWVVWFNRPYSGTADGILPAMRRRSDPARFVGLEIEVNQKHADDPAALDTISVQLVEAMRAALSLA